MAFRISQTSIGTGQTAVTAPANLYVRTVAIQADGGAVVKISDNQGNGSWNILADSPGISIGSYFQAGDTAFYAQSTSGAETINIVWTTDN